MVGYSDKPWLKTYERYGIPESINPPTAPIYTWLDDDVRICPNATAVTYLGREMSYKELGLHTDKMANALANLGVEKGDVVINAFVTSPQFVIADSALLKVGGVSTAFSSLLRAPDLEHQAKTSGAKVIFCEDTYVETVNSIKDKTKLEQIIVASREDYSARESPIPKEVPGTLSFRNLVAKYDAKPPRVEIDTAKDLAMLSFTGGATGLPKAVMLTHMNLWALYACSFATLFGEIGKVLFDPDIMLVDAIRGKTSMVAGLFPFNYFGGHCFCHMFLLVGANMLMVPDPRDVELSLRLKEEYNPLFYVSVPTGFMKELSMMEEKGIKASAAISYASAAQLPLEVAEKYEKATGVPISFQTYGLTEATAVSHANPKAIAGLFGGVEVFKAINSLVDYIPPRFLRSIKPILRLLLMPIDPKTLGKVIITAISVLGALGKRMGTRTSRDIESVGLPVQDTEAKLVDPDTGKEVPFGEPGELMVKGPTIMAGYWPERGKGLEDGYIHTGDILRMDEDGFFYIVDRVKDMINVSGYKVYSLWIDEVLYDHPGVEMGGTVGIPDPDRPGSERVKAFITLKPGYKGKVTEEDIKNICREKLPPYAVPKVVEFRDELPVTAADKIFKRKLREEEIEKMKHGE